MSDAELIGYAQAQAGIGGGGECLLRVRNYAQAAGIAAWLWMTPEAVIAVIADGDLDLRALAESSRNPLVQRYLTIEKRLEAARCSPGVVVP